MTKQDLKSGMICKHRDGRFSMVLRNTYEDGEGDLVFKHNNRSGLNAFSNNLKWSYTAPSPDTDIIAVYQPYNPCNGFVIFTLPKHEINTNYWKLLWSEPEPTEEMTLAEVCKALGKNIKIVK